jgi:cell division protein FtsB
MKKIIVSMALLFAIGLGTTSQQVFAQKKDNKKSSSKDKKGGSSKDDEKALKEELKNYSKNLASYKKFKETANENAKRASDLQKQVDALQPQVNAKQDEIDRLRAERDDVKRQLADAQKNAGNVQPVKVEKGIPKQGLVFCVQIGAYKKVNMDGGKSENFNTEKEGDVNKFMVGIFDTYPQAEEMKNNLRKMGLKDAWVVAYKDGARVDAKQYISGGTGK